MKSAIWVTPFLSALLAACGTASASEPDSNNPAHCVAAFTYGRTIALRSAKPDFGLAVESTARSIYEGRKLKDAGHFEAGRREGDALLSRYGSDESVMMPLVLACLKKQAADPGYRTLKESGALMAAARAVDPICRNSDACKSLAKPE